MPVLIVQNIRLKKDVVEWRVNIVTPSCDGLVSRKYVFTN